MKKVLILVLSSDFAPYDKMIETSLATWDSIDVENVETVFCCGRSTKASTDKIMYFPANNDLHSMGHKNLMSWAWALNTKEFDYIARTNASCYVNKRELIKHVQTLPDENVFAGVKVDTDPPFLWGGGQYLISRDVVEKIFDNRKLWNHSLMEDVSMSYVVNKLGIPYTQGIACSIDKTLTGWICMCYGTKSYKFNSFSEIKKDDGQFFFRVKQDGHRDQDEMIMHELYKQLK